MEMTGDARADERRAAIVESAIGVFARYGFRRASMEDLAEAAGMSRPALYQYFRNKAEIFRAGSELMQAQALAAAEAAAADAADAGLAPRLAAMLAAYKKPAWRIMATTPHGEEIIGLNAALAEDVTEAARARSQALFARVIASEAAAGWDAAEAARLLTDAAWAILQNSTDEAAFDADVAALARIWAAGLSGPPPE